MKTLLKTFAIVIGMGLIATGGAALLLRGRIETFVKENLERRLSAMYGAGVALEGVRALPWQGRVTLKGLAIENPEGFKEGRAVYFQRIAADFDMASIGSETPRIKKIALSGGEIHVRIEAGEGINVNRLVNNARRAREALEAEGKGAGRRRFAIDALEAGETTLELSANMPPASKSLLIAPFRLEHVNGGQSLDVSQFGEITLRSYLKNALTLKGLVQGAARVLREAADALEQKAGASSGEPAL